MLCTLIFFASRNWQIKVKKKTRKVESLCWKHCNWKRTTDWWHGRRPSTQTFDTVIWACDNMPKAVIRRAQVHKRHRRTRMRWYLTSSSWMRSVSVASCANYATEKRKTFWQTKTKVYNYQLPQHLSAFGIWSVHISSVLFRVVFFACSRVAWLWQLKWLKRETYRTV